MRVAGVLGAVLVGVGLFVGLGRQAPQAGVSSAVCGSPWFPRDAVLDEVQRLCDQQLQGLGAMGLVLLCTGLLLLVGVLVLSEARARS